MVSHWSKQIVILAKYEQIESSDSENVVILFYLGYSFALFHFEFLTITECVIIRRRLWSFHWVKLNTLKLDTPFFSIDICNKHGLILRAESRKRTDAHYNWPHELQSGELIVVNISTKMNFNYIEIKSNKINSNVFMWIICLNQNEEALSLYSSWTCI